MKYILCKLGIHKKGKLLDEWMCNVWGQGWDLYECSRCGKWFSRYIDNYFGKHRKTKAH